MLDAHIIEELKRQEEARRRAEEDGRSRVEQESPPELDRSEAESDENDRDEDATAPPVLHI